MPRGRGAAVTALRPEDGDPAAAAPDAVGKVGAARAGSGRREPLRAVPQDADLPHLATALDAGAMQTVFQRLLFDDPEPSRPAGQVERCEIEWIKYRPGKNCTVAYRVLLLERPAGRRTEQLWCGRVVGRGRSHTRFQALRMDDLVRPQFGPPAAHLPDIDTILWAFPNDSKLHALPVLLDAERLRLELLPAIVEAAAGTGWVITAATRDVVQYVPEESCVVRVHARLERDAGRRELTAYAKVQKEGSGAGTFATMQRLWACDARVQGRLRMAQPLGYDPERHIAWQLGVPGTALLEDGLVGPRAQALLARAAGSVAALHTCGVPCPRAAAVDDARSRLRDMRRILPQVAPSCRGRLEPLVDRLIAEGEDLGAQPRAVLHGDLRLRHLIVDGDDLTLIDVDTLCDGSPWQDIGSLAAAMLYKGILTGLHARVIDDSLATFCRHYAQHVPWTMSRAAVRWYTAVAVVNERAFRSVTRLQQDKLERVDDMLELASRILGPGGAQWC